VNARIELPQAREVCPTTTRRLIAEGALLVDVRERAEVESLAFDVPAIVGIPMSEFDRRFAKLPRDRELVLVCRVGERSLKATYFLMYQGYTRVANMKGGIAKWARKGFPVKGRPDMASARAGGCCGTDAAAPACCDGGGVQAPAGSCCCS
jgi:rhodanese-related sulfurtransferase